MAFATSYLKGQAWSEKDEKAYKVKKKNEKKKKLLQIFIAIIFNFIGNSTSSQD